MLNRESEKDDVSPNKQIFLHIIITVHTGAGMALYMSKNCYHCKLCCEIDFANRISYNMY